MASSAAGLGECRTPAEAGRDATQHRVLAGRLVRGGGDAGRCRTPDLVVRGKQQTLPSLVIADSGMSGEPVQESVNRDLQVRDDVAPRYLFADPLPGS